MLYGFKSAVQNSKLWEDYKFKLKKKKNHEKELSLNTLHFTFNTF